MATKRCSVLDCDQGGKIVHGMCRKHETRWQRHGDVTMVKRPDRTGPNNPHWRGDDISYRTAHDRVTRQRGKASEHRCVDCGRQARHWSYDGTDPNELSKPSAYGSIKRWSADPAH